jgi:hypothetical protein
VGVDRQVRIGGNDSLSVGASRIVGIGANETIEVGANATAAIGANRSTVVGAKDTLAAAGNQSVTLGGDFSHNVAGRVDVSTKGEHAESFGSNFVAKHAGHRVVVVGTAEHRPGPAVLVRGSSRRNLDHVGGPAPIHESQLDPPSMLAYLERCLVRLDKKDRRRKKRSL